MKTSAAHADVAIFSFHAVKNLPTADAGMVCFQDTTLDEQARAWSWLGIDKDTYSRTVSSTPGYTWRYDVEHTGFTYHGNSVMAAIGLVSLKYLDQDNRYRRELAAAYDGALAGCASVRTVLMAPGCEPSRHLYQILVHNRDGLMAHLNSQAIYPGVHYRDNTAYPMYRDAAGTCPKAKRASDELISCPFTCTWGEATRNGSLAPSGRSLTKRQILPLQGPSVTLRLVARADMPRMLAWRNKDRVRPAFINSSVLSADEHGKWFDAYAKRDDDFVFFIEERDSGRSGKSLSTASTGREARQSSAGS